MDGATAADYTRLDPRPAAEALRARALAGLARALGGEAAMPPADPILPWCAPGTAPPSRALARWRAAHPALAPATGDPVVQAVVAGTLPARRWRLWRRPAPPLAGQGQALGPLVALAFAAAGFRLAVARRLRAHLAARVILHPGPAVLPPLSPLLCLCLAADWSAPGEQPLSRAAARLAAAPGWAGFTEQWLVREAASRAHGWPAALRELPVAARGRQALLETAADDPGPCTPGWRDRAPGWAMALLNGTP